MMNEIVNDINRSLSLRKPLQESLEVLSEILELQAFEKDIDLEVLTEKIKDFAALHQAEGDVLKSIGKFISFERSFPSYMFSIATGIGKTRLMAAFIVYLYRTKNVKNFFILSPNLTIYNKLIEDFGNPTHPKYVFQGISEFAHQSPLIINGDNYAQQSGLFEKAEVRINIFNIAKFNSDSKGSKGTPRLKRLSEYMGQSYWSFLSNQKDLVLLMDEAHRYVASASHNALNELNPVLGLELTATPFIDDKGNLFENIIYEYGLGAALGQALYTKQPAVAKRQNFDPKGMDQAGIDRIKLLDAVSVHQDTKLALEQYALDNKVHLVKPFVLVACQNIEHAKEVEILVQQIDFADGYYKEKVLRIDSTTRKNVEEVEQLFLTLEHSDNPIEIVIHVAMLAEGWDVTNLYTIVPLRASNSVKLIEQTMGRGLRLPYAGTRTGNEKVDKLTIIDHENFEKIVEAAQDPNSIFNKIELVQIDVEALNIKAEIVKVLNRTQEALVKEKERIATIADVPKRQEATIQYEARALIINAVQALGSNSKVKNIDSFQLPAVRELVIEEAKKELTKGNNNIFAEAILDEIKAVYTQTVSSIKKESIQIPRLTIQHQEVVARFDDFDLNTDGFSYRILDKNIIRVNLTGDRKTDLIKLIRSHRERPGNMIIGQLMNYPEVDYVQYSVLIQKLVGQAMQTLRENPEIGDRIGEVIEDFYRPIADEIYNQMKQHFHLEEKGFVSNVAHPFRTLESWNFSHLISFGQQSYDAVINPTSNIDKYIYKGFEKACHVEYKFDSKAEKDFATILERDVKVEKWLRPAKNQFDLYYRTNTHDLQKKYEPDFVVETVDCIYLVEIKSLSEIDDVIVLAKAASALQYCKEVSKYNAENGGKSWVYLLIPHTEVKINSSFEYLTVQFLKK
jgi:type III restriction enzyme